VRQYVISARLSLYKALYRQRHKIENMFGKLKDWRRIATLCPHLLLGHLHRCNRHLLALINES
jgi:transposase